MKSKIIIESLVLAVISVSAIAAPADDYFFPGGTWTGAYSGVCKDGSDAWGQATMEVHPLTVTDTNSGENEYFTGTMTLENLPPDCLDINFTNPTIMTKESYAVSSNGTADGVYFMLHTKDGTVSTQGAWVPAYGSDIDMGFTAGKSGIFVTFIPPMSR